MKIGHFPVRYLGVALVGTRILAPYRQPLKDRILQRLTSWTVRYLTYAGRLQLLKSVVFGIWNYWTLIFPLPKSVLIEIE